MQVLRIYVSTRLGFLFRKAALRDGFRLVDFARILVTLGLTVTLLGIDEDDAWAARARKRALQQGAKRRYSTSRSMSGRGVWVGVCLPDGVLTLVDKYANASGLARNQALSQFLQLGLLTYLKGGRALLRAIRELGQKAMEPTTGASTTLGGRDASVDQMNGT